MKLSDAQEEQLANLKAHFPFRICWGMIDKETGEFSCFAAFDKRGMNKAARQGHFVVALTYTK
jgi:cytochrome b